MKSLYLINHPECFQGEEFLHNMSDYFEGWYFKISNKKDIISFIPGISINNKKASCFIQIIYDKNSYFIPFEISEFKFSNSPFYVKIGNNIFSKNMLKLDINFKDICINGKISLFDDNNISKNLYAPNIMGPFSYLSSMECNHAILSMKSIIKGKLNINSKEFIDGYGYAYIEKDWGTSFPKSYIWCQGNEFPTRKNSFMLSIADIPMGDINFKGIISILSLKNKQYKFTTYYGAKIKQLKINKNIIYIKIKQGNKTLTVTSTNNNGMPLLAPTKGKMNTEILESITSKITIKLEQNQKTIYKESSINSGIEIVT